MRNDIMTLKRKTVNGTSKIETLFENIFCEKKSIVRTEFYDSYKVGISPKYTFNINSDDWQQTMMVSNGQEVYPQSLIYNGIEYSILRTYQPRGDEIELVVM